MVWVGRDLKYHLVPTSSIHCVRKELNAVGGKKLKILFIFTVSVLCMNSQLSVNALFFFPKKIQKASFFQLVVGWALGGPWVGQAAGLGTQCSH